MSRHRWLAMSALLLAVACGVAPSRELASHAGKREWLSPFGSGELDLREDSSFSLSVRHARSGSRWEVSGQWQVVQSSEVVLLVRNSCASHPNADEWGTWPVLASGTEILAIVSGDLASYLGLDGVVDLNWGM